MLCQCIIWHYEPLQFLFFIFLISTERSERSWICLCKWNNARITTESEDVRNSGTWRAWPRVCSANKMYWKEPGFELRATQGELCCPLSVSELAVGLASTSSILGERKKKKKLHCSHFFFPTKNGFHLCLVDYFSKLGLNIRV